MAFITPLQSRMIPLDTVLQDKQNSIAEQNALLASGQPTFLDVFKNIVSDAVTTTNQQTQDTIDLALGNLDDIEGMQANIAKAEIAVELLVNVKNTVVEAYNEIIKMQI